MEFVILGKYLLPGGGQVLEHTGLAVKGGIIAAVDDNQSLLRDYPQYTVLDRTDAVISPGFVNAHMHAYGLLSHGITPPGTIDNFEAFLNDFWWPLVEDRIDFPMIIASGRAAALELVNSGVTAFCDVLEAPYAVPGGLKTLAGVIEETGMRAVLSFEASERVSREQGNAGLEENRQFFLEYRDHPSPGNRLRHSDASLGKPLRTGMVPENLQRQAAGRTLRRAGLSWSRCPCLPGSKADSR